MAGKSASLAGAASDTADDENEVSTVKGEAEAATSKEDQLLEEAVVYIMYPEDPAKTTYTQIRMRQHFYQCINRGIMSLFPSASSVRDDSGILSTETIELYCKCRMPEIPPMVECSSCGEWFHTEYVNVPDDALDDTHIPWFCCSCDGECS